MVGGVDRSNLSATWSMMWRPFAKMAMSAAVAMIMVLTLRAVPWGYSWEVDAETWGIFFTVVGVIYAIVVGFLIVDLLSRYHTLGTQIHAELNAIEDVRDYLVYVDHNEDAKEAIIASLGKYVESLVGTEWERMSQSTEEVGTVVDLESDTSIQIYEVMKAVEEIELHDASDQIALTAIIRRLADITTHRTERLELAKAHLTPPLRLLVVFMSVVIAFAFILMRVDSLVIHTYMVVSSVVAIHLLYIVLEDLSHPFRGIWNIRKKPFEDLAARLRSREALIRSGITPPSAEQIEV